MCEFGPADCDLHNVVQGQQRGGERHVDPAPQPGLNLPQFDPEPRHGFGHHKKPEAVPDRVPVRRQSLRRTRLDPRSRVAGGSRRPLVGADAAWRRRSGRGRPDASEVGTSRHSCSSSFLRLSLPASCPVLAHPLGDRPALLVAHRALPPADRLGRLFPAAPGGRRSVSLDRQLPAIRWIESTSVDHALIVTG